jgi:hypothetical protein
MTITNGSAINTPQIPIMINSRAFPAMDRFKAFCLRNRCLLGFI